MKPWWNDLAPNTKGALLMTLTMFLLLGGY